MVFNGDTRIVKGKRKLIFFSMLLLVAAYSLDGSDLSNVLIALATAFGLANGAEHIGGKNNGKD